MGGATNLCSICGSSYEASALYCPKDGGPLGSAAPAHDPFVGLEIADSIRLERLIGVGSMGRVYRGFQRTLGRSVAVKILHKELSANATIVGRFEREAQIAARLSHPHIIQVISAGQLPRDSGAGGALYIVMEYLDGISLRSALAGGGGALSLLRGLRITLQLCQAVGEAHAQGIVHRDIKPENVMLLQRQRETDFVKVLDFGIARLPFGATPAVTQAGLVFGTARYISPEGAAGTPVGPAADVYAIATILYQALSGRTPFEGGSNIDILAKQMSEVPPPLGSIERARYVPEPIARVIMCNLAKQPDARASDALALGRALLSAAREAGLAPHDLLVAPANDKRAPSLPSLEQTKPMDPAFALAPDAARAHAPHAVLASASHVTDALTPEPEIASAPPRQGARRGQGTALAFLAGCALTGVGLAFVGVGPFREPPAPPPPATADRAHAPDAATAPPSGASGARSPDR